MAVLPRQAGSFSVKKGEPVFEQNADVQTLDLLLQGKVDFYITPMEPGDPKAGCKPDKCFHLFSAGQSLFLGGGDLFHSGKYSYSCMASEDSNLYAFPAANPEQFMTLINSQKDYGAYVMNSLCTLIENSFTVLVKLQDFAASLDTVTENLGTYFWMMKEKNGFEYTPSLRFLREGLDRLQSLRDIRYQLPPSPSVEFFEKDLSYITGEKSTGTGTGVKKAEYYKRLGSLSPELRRSFFSADPLVTCCQCSDAAEYLNIILDEIRESFLSVRDIFARLYTDSSECIYSAYLKAAEETAAAGYYPDSVFAVVDYIVLKVTETLQYYKTEYRHDCETDLDYIRCACTNAKAAAAKANSLSGAGNSVEGREVIPEELKDSAKKLVEYAGLPEEKASFFLMNLVSFRNLRDRLSTDEEVRGIRSNISSVFFDIYEAVFKKACSEKDPPRLVNMFLLFGYMDEKLLTPEQVLTLYRLAGKEDEYYQGSICSMKDWLTAIYRQVREPSINEFGQDYNDIFREMKKRGEITDKDKAKYDGDIQAKLNHEIMNLFRINQRLCSGQINIYFPILHRDIITRDLSKSIVTADAVNVAIRKILDVDYSAFHREISFRDPEKGIEKELVMKPVYPDIILVPTFGSRAIMWQDIAVRNRSTPARFLIPMFTDENLDDMVLKLVGNFRWELCRTVMGSFWNDITEPSLTSEYSDYIQFYKKNRDLTEEAREKLRAQINKYHSKARDIFTADYETWVTLESKGVVRLNKVARGIFYRYCPFSRQLREQIDRQPLFNEAGIQLRVSRVKMVKELESRYNRYAKLGPLDPALEHNLKFYRDM